MSSPSRIKPLVPFTTISVEDQCEKIESFFNPNRINISPLNKIIEFYKNVILHIFSNTSGQKAWIELPVSYKSVINLLDPSKSSMMKFITTKHHITIDYQYSFIPESILRIVKQGRAKIITQTPQQDKKTLSIGLFDYFLFHFASYALNPPTYISSDDYYADKDIYVITVRNILNYLRDICKNTDAYHFQGYSPNIDVTYVLQVLFDFWLYIFKKNDVPSLRRIISINEALEFVQSFLYSLNVPTYHLTKHSLNNLLERKMMKFLQDNVKLSLYNFILNSFRSKYWPENTIMKNLDNIVYLWLCYLVPWKAGSDENLKEVKSNIQSESNYKGILLNMFGSTSESRLYNSEPTSQTRKIGTVYSQNDSKTQSNIVIHERKKFITNNIIMYTNLLSEFLTMATAFDYTYPFYTTILRRMTYTWKDNDLFQLVLDAQEDVDEKSLDINLIKINDIELFSKAAAIEKALNDAKKSDKIKSDPKVLARMESTINDLKEMYTKDYKSLAEIEPPNFDTKSQRTVSIKEDKVTVRNRFQKKKNIVKINVDKRNMPVLSSENGFLVKLFQRISTKIESKYGTYINTRILASVKFHFWLSLLSIIIISAILIYDYILDNFSDY